MGSNNRVYFRGLNVILVLGWGGPGRIKQLKRGWGGGARPPPASCPVGDVPARRLTTFAELGA